MTSLDNDNKSKNGLLVDKHSKTESYKSDDENTSLSQSSPSCPPEQISTNFVTNLCIVCSKNRRALAFVPCGHFAVCVPCGHGLKSCPTCGSNIKGLLRIYD
ncbi:unnamed protein product [Rotaria sp. Silwood1]|nr:unnamed protein product [Rotaria sp. Silwood1]CAF0911140.1 unnamed protein product [Rotaria sp. Silwood1]CAF1061435.1 unnamed protein product [Rotaria sp. Silwood1]CAF3373326.1 unnamed protein product [Rotaria sp. Silwood1]CAF3376311.1 unnamed protein product [Rotaria sp. Silwood1]